MNILPYYEKKMDCLHCKKSFPTSKVRSKSIKILDADHDFMPHYAEGTINAIYYNVFVCEHCGFSFTEDFSKYFAPGVQEEIQTRITASWVPRHFNGERTVNQAIQAYKLAFLCATIKREKYIITAGLTLRIAWLYRQQNMPEQEQRFLKLACEHYLESYSTEDYKGTQMSDIRVMYMVAELSRRINDYDTATRFLSRVIESQRNGGEAKLVEMAKEQWEVVRVARNQ